MYSLNPQHLVSKLFFYKYGLLVKRLELKFVTNVMTNIHHI